jgi:hypothetical protein
MINNLELQSGSLIALLFRVISSIVLIFLLIPLQLKEAKVKNGLRMLRLKLLSVGFILLVTNILSIGLIFITGVDVVLLKILTAVLQFMNAVSALALALVFLSIYHQSYTEAAKKVHIEVDKQEKLDEKKNKVIDNKKRV